jgi:cytidine deaminase
MPNPSLMNRSSLSADAVDLAISLLPSMPFEPYRNEWLFDNRLDLAEPQLALAAQLLDFARHQQFFAASPLLSHFKVGASGHCGDQRLALGSNHERGAGPGRAYDDAIHGEDAVISDALNRYGRDTRLEMIVYTTDASAPSCSCGRCRGAIESYTNGDIPIVSAGSGDEVSMWYLSELLPKEFPLLDRAQLSLNEGMLLEQLLSESELSGPSGFNHFSKSTLGLSVAAISADQQIFSLPRVDALAFYGTSSIAATISAVMRAQAETLDAVLISTQSGLPTAEDRQLLYEFASMYSSASTLTVYMKSADDGSIRVATPAQLLPYAFGPGDLGIDFSRVRSV